MKKLLVFVLFLSIAAPAVCFSQSVNGQKEKFASVYKQNKALVTTKNYQYEGQWIVESRNRKQVEAASNTLVIAKRDAKGQLSTLSTHTININGKLNDYKVAYNDDQLEIVIEFTVDGHNANIKIMPNGKAFLTLKSGGKTISQVGTIKKH